MVALSQGVQRKSRQITSSKDLWKTFQTKRGSQRFLGDAASAWSCSDYCSNQGLNCGTYKWQETQTFCFLEKWHRGDWEKTGSNYPAKDLPNTNHSPREEIKGNITSLQGIRNVRLVPGRHWNANEQDSDGFCHRFQRNNRIWNPIGLHLWQLLCVTTELYCFQKCSETETQTDPRWSRKK